MAEQIKVAILEQKLEDLKHIVVRIDTAIEKLGEVNSNVSKMLAVHEERITKQEEIDSVLFTKIDKLRDKMDGDHDLIRARLALLERRIWGVVGALAAITLISNPQTMKLIKPLLSGSNPATMTPVVAIVDGSR
jgi:hypothetical protein|tara:strand:- start:175 stop:576 length:402 start_codon:yes stop_codon:yes gene_type:complete